MKNREEFWEWVASALAVDLKEKWDYDYLYMVEQVYAEWALDKETKEINTGQVQPPR